MINFNNKLEIFERFETDKNLPKYKSGVPTDLVPSVEENGLTANFQPLTQFTFGSSTTGFGSSTFGTIMIGDQIVYPQQFNQPKKQLKDWVVFKWFKKKQEDLKVRTNDQKKKMTIIAFFSSLATSLNDLKTLTDIAVHYETAITNAITAGQIALADQLKERLNSAKSEAQLVAYGLNKYLTEEQVVEFYGKAQKDKNLKLTWIKHFIKPIPSKILDLKKKLDTTFVFDNYVILHYDPNNDATTLTNKEKEELKRDPILFGVIEKSRRLYYIGDWIDDYCNLTLDLVMETVGGKIGEINNETVKTFIDRGFVKTIASPVPASGKTVVDPKKVIIKAPVMIKEGQSKEKTKRR